jgi:hypothetical protein
MQEIDAIRRRISRRLSFHGIATDGVQITCSAYKDLINGKPSSFQEFLKNAAARFIEVGEAFGMIMHMRSFCSFRFRDVGTSLSEMKPSNSSGISTSTSPPSTYASRMRSTPAEATTATYFAGAHMAAPCG